jgi:hypothetical protein
VNATLLLILFLCGFRAEPRDIASADDTVEATDGENAAQKAAEGAGPGTKSDDAAGRGTAEKVTGKAASPASANPPRKARAEARPIPLHAPLAGRVAIEQQAGGSHMRLETNHGPVHLFRPPGFDRKTAGVVVYVHGYYTHIDEAWYEHKLAEQFVASRRNALFIAPEAPAAPEEKPSWTSLRRLLTVVFRMARVKEPAGPLVVAGHSGAYRTLVPWLDEPALHHLILIDALYGNEPDFLDWLARERINRMTLVVKGTAKWADPFVKSLPYAVTLPRIPRAITDLSHAARAAKLLCLRSQYGHFELITEGRVMPVLLGRCGLKTCRRPALKDESTPATLRHGRRTAGLGR